MGFLRFFISKGFLLSLLAMIVIIISMGFAMLGWLDDTTNHGEVVTVPNLSKMHYSKISKRLKRDNLDFVLIDSVDYRKDFPALSVVEQDPEPGAKVKKFRKIYVKINSSTYGQVVLPDLIQVSYRQAIPTLKSLGLKEGKITYRANIGKDMVLKMMYKGKELKPGDKVTKTSKIDLVLGDGFMGAQVNEEDQYIQELMDQLNEEE